MPTRSALAALLAAGLLAACSGGSSSGSITRTEPALDSIGTGSGVRPVAALKARVRPDVAVVAPAGLSESVVARLRALAPAGLVTVRIGPVGLAGRPAQAVAVDPSTFRAFAPAGTAESTPVWQSVARGEAVVSHARATAQKLPLSKSIDVAGAVHLPLRLGALATTALPDVSLVVSDAVGAKLGLRSVSGALLSAGRADPVVLAESVRRVVGPSVRVDLLTTPTQQLAFLTGGRAGRLFGAFSYRYFAGGTIEPDAAWVSRYITYKRVPLLGIIGCHRLMFPQLIGALTEVQQAGLGGKLRTYDGCYNPRFIEFNPARSVSLHTWGIAIDLNAATNKPGMGRGDIDQRIVDIFTRWGFAWGGYWDEPDPMHFQLAALLDSAEVKKRRRS